MNEDRPYAPEAAALEVDVTRGPPPGAVSIGVCGQVDFDNVATLRPALLAAFASHRGPRVVDLSQVTFCDCAASTPSWPPAQPPSGRPRLDVIAAGPVEWLLRPIETQDLLT
ncbi:STAS domain-containing protein [Streptomyces sp. NPDC001552]|uniref:STAS domain-containing protein n=1 Tax=Streptomyces sp. NPDC001552 TaxID=3364587 RepID=UPI0036CB8FFB